MNKKLKSFIVMLLAVMLADSASALTVEHPWEGKRVAFLGDSITDPRNKAANQKYWYWLQEWLGITPYVYAVSGRQWDDVPRQAGLLKSEHGQDVDAILIFMGTNDYNNAVPIGEWYTEQMDNVEYGHGYPKRMEYRKHRMPNLDASTFKGRINIALDSLKRVYPDKQIVLLTPIHRSGFYANEKNWQVSEDYANRCGEYLDAYIDAVKEAGQVWAVPVIDLSALCGLYPLMGEYGKYFNDAENDLLHPNNEGHKRMAQTLMFQLLQIPTF